MRVISDNLERILSRIDTIVRWIVVVALLTMTIVLFFNSIGRSALNVSFVGAAALGRLLVIWLTFLGAYLAVRTGSHITVDILQRFLTPDTVRKLSIPVGIAGAVTTAWIAWLSAAFTMTRFSFGQIEPMLEIPTGIFYLPLPIGASLMTLAFLQTALRSALGDAPETGSGED